MSARDNILARIRRATGGGDAVAVAVRLGQRDVQLAPVPAQAQTQGEARITQFIDKATAVDATVSRLASLDDLPAALADELRKRNLPAAIWRRTTSRPVSRTCGRTGASAPSTPAR